MIFELSRPQFNSRMRAGSLQACLAAIVLLTSAISSATLAAQAAPPATAPGAVTQPVAGATANGAAPATAGATTPAAGTAAAAPASRQSWFSDRRSFAVGDIITILIDDYTITTAVKENIASDTRSRGLGLTARLPAGQTKSAGLDTRNDAQQNQRGSAKRENRFQNEMSVRVIATGANGLLQVKGTKNINVDKAMQDIVLTGWVRAQDVSPDNLVESARLADATIGYASPGALAKPKKGFVSKILGAIWP